jgi:ABC-type phosphate transport system substrate-binding protein
MEEESMITSRWPSGRVAIVTALAALTLALPRASADAASYAAISGSGSSWSSVAIDQWAEDVRTNGLVVNYNPDGSAAGRTDYTPNEQVDFAGSDPPFRNGQDYLGGTSSELPARFGYSYIPDTAGGTAFMYHVTVGGHLVRNLRLRPRTIMGIFTGQITNWADQRITTDYGTQLPSEPITPVIRSDGSGATFFLTRWMAHMFPSDWNRFCQQVHPGVHIPCGQTEFYPQFGNAKAQNGSNNVATYITASYGEGSIGYDEYAYALNANFPVVKVLNPANYWVLPTASNDAVALTKAIINNNSRDPNYLQQNLDNVYAYNDPRSYPLSSYSYLIVPRSGEPVPAVFSNQAGRSLSTFINYLLCGGQGKMAELGYSPLPINLIQGGFAQVARIPGHVTAQNLATCTNPNLNNGQSVLLRTAAEPSPCDKLGAPLNCTVVNGRATGTNGSTNGNGSGNGAGPTNGTTGPGASGRPTTGPGTSVNPVTGQVNGPGNGTLGASNVAGQVVPIAGTGAEGVLLATLTALAVVGSVTAPPAIGFWLRRRRRTT